MQSYAKFAEQPLSGIEPEGWLKKYLEDQRNGLTGHMEVADYPFNAAPWAKRRGVAKRHGDDWWPYEQTGYWIDGMVRCGHLLRDNFLLKKADKSIRNVLDHPDKDGYLGPRHLKDSTTNSHWVHAVFFRALMAHHSAAGDRSIPRALEKHYLGLKRKLTKSREVCNVEQMIWTYLRTGNKRLLRKAIKVFDGHNRNKHNAYFSMKTLLSDDVPFGHGVSYNEMAKIGAILYMATGDRRALRTSVKGYEKLDRYHMLVSGVHSSSEWLCGKRPLDSHETCDVADYTWSLGYLLMATGDPKYADKIERACLNAGPGIVRTHDWKALQYFSSPNQVLATNTSDHNDFQRGGAGMSFRPNPFTECCPGEVNRIMPDYGTRMWMQDRDGNPFAALYGPSRLTTKIGQPAKTVTITEETDYPFGERIDFRIETRGEADFTLVLRIPGWCRKAKLLLNGQRLKMKTAAGTVVKIKRTFANLDRVTLFLPMDIKLTRWQRGGVALERGPLAYSLAIEEDWRIDRKDKKSTRDFPAYELFPASPWNYALAVDRRNLKQQVFVVHNRMTADPWTLDTAPVELWAPARRVKGWKLLRRKRVEAGYRFHGRRGRIRKGNFVMTPDLPKPKELHRMLAKDTEMVRLVPLGCTHLRLTIFPDATKT